MADFNTDSDYASQLKFIEENSDIDIEGDFDPTIDEIADWDLNHITIKLFNHEIILGFSTNYLIDISVDRYDCDYINRRSDLFKILELLAYPEDAHKILRRSLDDSLWVDYLEDVRDNEMNLERLMLRNKIKKMRREWRKLRKIN